jgi:hypothetical protein
VKEAEGKVVRRVVRIRPGLVKIIVEMPSGTHEWYLRVAEDRSTDRDKAKPETREDERLQPVCG